MHTFGKGQCKTPAVAATPAEALWRDSSGIFIKKDAFNMADKQKNPLKPL